MHLPRYERAERLRFHAIEAAGAPGDEDLVALAAGDASAVQSAWSSFVPYLAHPVMAGSAGAAMGLLDAAASAVAKRQPLPV